MSVTSVNERLAALTAAGTSVWLDQMRRGMIETVSSPGWSRRTRCAASRPTRRSSRRRSSGRPTTTRISPRPPARGCRRARCTAGWRSRTSSWPPTCCAASTTTTGGVDGYVSLEVAPRLAHDTEGTLEQARMYWDLVDRPNLMIKIPATEEGIPAIEQALYEGMNVNVTLLFAVSYYERVMEAFIAAMERRQAEGKPLDRHSVASFFVSRVDTEVDKRLEAAGRTDLAGRAGLANARAAYQAFKQVFDGERFAELRDAGCPVQRPLWASTGVKNPAYPETMYVYGLVGPDIVNTMPLPTLTAAAREGEVTGATAADDPTADLDALREAGIDIDDVTDKLLRDGIEAFLVPMAKLLDGIELKREAIVTGRPGAIEADLPAEFEQAVAARIKKAADDDVVHRIWHRDGTLWAPGGHARGDRPPRLARHLREAARERRRPRGLRRRGARRGLHRRRAARHGRLEPRAGGVPALDDGPRDEAARARLDAPGADPVGRRRARPRQDVVHRVLEVRRDDRDDVAVQVLPRAPARRRALRGGDRPGHLARQARRRARLPAGVRERQRDRRPLLGAVVLRPRPRGAHRRRHPRGARGRRGRRPQLPAQGGQRRPVARHRARRARPQRARQADVRRRRPADRVRPVGRAARRRVDRQARPRHPADRRRAARSTPAPTGRTACSCTSPPATPPTRRMSRRSARRAIRRSPSTPRGRTTSDGSSSTPSSRPRSSAGCWRSTRSTSPTCRRRRTTRAACSRKAHRTSIRAASTRCSTASARRATSRSSATCRTAARPTRRSRASEPS